ncbi:LysR substrate-binding domain-containing protein [Pendulispora albinea]|uniref:LysR substrate-binding domain-containing protein n=1 Tax=Pendulispora albinea TaxID=2741071 RepID=A0ABZ2LUR7_9BACT
MDITGIDLNLLVVLDALLAERSVTLAAKRLRLSQSGTSAALGRLRLLLDDPLFARTPRGLSPTPRALLLVEPVRQILTSVEHVLAAPKFDPATAERTVRLAMGDYAQYVVLPALLSRLAREAPRVAIAVTPLVREPRAHLDDGSCELVLAPGLKTAGALHAETLFHERMTTIARKGVVGKKLGLRQFTSLGHVLVSPEGSGGAMVDRALAERKLRRFIALRVPHFLVAPEVVARSELIATLPDRVARRAAEALPVRGYVPPVPLPSFSIALGWHARSEGDPALSWLRATLQKVARDRESGG